MVPDMAGYGREVHRLIQNFKISKFQISFFVLPPVCCVHRNNAEQMNSTVYQVRKYKVHLE